MQNKLYPASIPHERLMLNLALFHMLLPIAALGSGYILPILTLALLGSLLSISWIAWYARYHQFESDLEQQHWSLAWKHCRWLLIAYGVSTLIMLLGWLLSKFQADHTMAEIILVIFTRIAAVPTLLMVLVLFVVETSALSESRKRH